MRHRKRRTKLGRQPAHRKATIKSLTRSVILHERIKTTHAKAKEARRIVDKMIELAKDDNLAARRRAFSLLGERTIVKKLFKEIGPLFKERKGGYTRIIPFNYRKGDGASMVFLELTEKKPEEKVVKKGKKSKKVAVKDTKVPPKAKKTEEKLEHPKAAPSIEPKVKEEKIVEDVRKEKARDETRKIEKHKGFLKKMKGFFRRRTNM